MIGTRLRSNNERQREKEKEKNWKDDQHRAKPGRLPTMRWSGSIAEKVTLRGRGCFSLNQRTRFRLNPKLIEGRMEKRSSRLLQWLFVDLSILLSLVHEYSLASCHSVAKRNRQSSDFALSTYECHSRVGETVSVAFDNFTVEAGSLISADRQWLIIEERWCSALERGNTYLMTVSMFSSTSFHQSSALRQSDSSTNDLVFRSVLFSLVDEGNNETQ